jgi:hypothetical protein
VKGIIVMAVCWPVGLFTAMSTLQFFNLDLSSVPLIIWVGAIAGSLLGIAQWLTLEHKIDDFRIWMLATILGTVIGLTVTLSISRQVNLGWAWIVAGVLGGAILGLSQSLSITINQRLDLSWILITSTSWGLAFIIGLGLTPEFSSAANIMSTDAILMIWIIGWGILGILTIFIVLVMSPIDKRRDRNVPMQWC